MLGDKGGCLFASLDVVFGQQLLKIGQKLVFCPFLEAGSNLSRWQRKQVIWKKNLSYSDEWGRQSRGRDSCSLLELLFNFFLRLGVKWRGDPRGFADDHFLAGKGPSYSSLLLKCSYNPIQFCPMCRPQWTLTFCVNEPFLDSFQQNPMSNDLTKTKPRPFYELTIRVTW